MLLAISIASCAIAAARAYRRQTPTHRSHERDGRIHPM